MPRRIFIPVVVSEPGSEFLILAYGRICDWKMGIAADVLAGKLVVSRFVISCESRTIQSPRGVLNSNLINEKPREFLYGTVKRQGFRPHMEDESIVIDDLCCVKKDTTAAYFAIVDGHNGSDVMEFVINHSQWSIAQEPECIHAIPQAIRQAFAELDKDVLAQSRTQGWESGAVVTVVILVSMPGSIPIQKCIIGHCGDARAILSRNARPVVLTTDQMVGNLLGVSRSIGDMDVETGEKIRGVCFKTHVLEFDSREEEDELVHVAMDGFWDTFSNADAIAHALKLLCESKKTSDEACELLVTEALRRGCTDNIALCMIQFQRPTADSLSLVVDLNGSRPGRLTLALDGLSQLKQALDHIQ